MHPPCNCWPVISQIRHNKTIMRIVRNCIVLSRTFPFFLGAEHTSKTLRLSVPTSASGVEGRLVHLLGAPWPRTLCWRSIIGTAAQNRRVHSFADRFGGHSLAANRCPNSSQNYHWIKAKALLAGYSIEKWMVGPNNFKLGNRQTHWYCTEQNMPKLNNLNRPAKWGNQAIGASPTSMLLGRRCGPSTK